MVFPWPRSAHTIHYNFSNKMARQEPVGFIRRPSDYGIGDEDGPDFIRCVDGRQPQIHEVWGGGKDGVTCEVHPTEQLDVGAGFFG